MKICSDKEQAGEDKGRDDGEESRIPKVIRAETGDNRCTKTETKRKHQADGCENSISGNGQES